MWHAARARARARYARRYVLYVRGRPDRTGPSALYIAECTYSMRIMVAHCRVAAALAAVQLLVMQGI
eukprot:COSAG02_NODE_508_length_20916_cov_162.483691_1_plen_66_part_10